MTSYKTLMTDVLEGRAASFLPFSPRLDIWFHSHKRSGTLPARYAKATLLDVLEDLDIGYNTMIPDYLDHDGPDDQRHRGLGFHSTRTSTVFTLDFPGIPIQESWEQDHYRVVYQTPYGDLSTVTRLDEGMKRQGATIAVTVKKAIESVDDFKAARYLFEHAQIRPAFDRYRHFQDRVGQRGLSTAFVLQRESGFRMLNMDLMAYDQALYAQLDAPDEFASLCALLDQVLEQCVAVACASPADLLTVGAHFDTGLTPPALFRAHTLPMLQTASKMIHESGKQMASHTDSENRQLLPLYVEAGMDVADSICQEPLTSLTYQQIRAVTGDRITLYGLIPSITVLKESFSDADFDAFLDQLFSDIQLDGGRHIILAVADTTPPGADLARISKIARLARQVKPV